MNSIYGMIAIIIVATLTTIVFFDVMIPYLRRIKYGQTVRSEGPSAHLKKNGTPTMGGIVITITTIILSLSLFLFNYKVNSLDFKEMLLLYIPFIGFSIIGFIDDFLIVVKKNNDGIKPITKFIMQLIISAITFFLILDTRGTDTINFFGTPFKLSFLYGVFIVIMFVGITNATNITDGIDGLLGGSALIVTVGILMLSLHISNSEVTYFSISLIVALVAFLIYNLPKASIFMGDTGSLAIGSGIFSMLISLNMDILIFVFGLTFIIETVSVMLQVWFFKRTKGKRILKMAPIHHHLELSGFKEYQVDIIIWGITLIMVIVGVKLGVWLF